MKKSLKNCIVLCLMCMFVLSLTALFCVTYSNANTAVPVLVTDKAMVRVLQENEYDSVNGLRFRTYMSKEDYEWLIGNENVSVYALIVPNEKLEGQDFTEDIIGPDNKINGATVGKVKLLEKTADGITVNAFKDSGDTYEAYCYVAEFPFAKTDSETDEEYAERLTALYRYGIACRTYYEIDSVKTYSVNEFGEQAAAVRSMEQVAYLALQDGDSLSQEVKEILESYITTYAVSYMSDGALYDFEFVKYGEQTTKVPAEPYKPGYRFIGWEKDGQTASFPIEVKDELVFNAVFEEVEITADTKDLIAKESKFLFTIPNQYASIGYVENVEVNGKIVPKAFKITNSTATEEVPTPENSTAYIAQSVVEQFKNLGFEYLDISFYSDKAVAPFNWSAPTDFNGMVALSDYYEGIIWKIHSPHTEQDVIYITKLELSGYMGVIDASDTDLTTSEFDGIIVGKDASVELVENFEYQGVTGNFFKVTFLAPVEGQWSSNASVSINLKAIEQLRAAGRNALKIEVYFEGSSVCLANGQNLLQYLGASGTLAATNTTLDNLATARIASNGATEVYLKISVNTEV